MEHQTENDSQKEKNDTEQPSVTRRTILSTAGSIGLLGIGASSASAKGQGKGRGKGRGKENGGEERDDTVSTTYVVSQQHQNSAYQIRHGNAVEQLRRTDFPDHEHSGDNERYDNKIASFTKGLPHDELGEVDVSEYEQLQEALESGRKIDFERISLGGDRKLANPRASLGHTESGADPQSVTMNAAPAFSSDENAAEMVELYWQRLTCDIPFGEYSSSQKIQDAASELSEMTDFSGPVSPENLFRGIFEGNQVGPYVSQFLLQPIQRGAIPQEQKVDALAPGQQFLTDYDDWLAVQRGEEPTESSEKTDELKYICTGRDLCTYVHVNYPQQPFLNAALILENKGMPRGDGNPFADSTTEGAFVEYGKPDVFGAVTDVMQKVVRTCWVHKWLVHKRARPEEVGGRVHNHLEGKKEYPLASQLLESDAVSRTKEKYGSYLLPQAYPEGSPTHPSYPAGHSGIAGACTTVLKAYYDEDAVIPDPVQSTPDGQELRDISDTLTVGGELNKLAANNAIGRNFAGIHYRTDGTDGLRLGEEYAIRYLQDRVDTQHSDASYTLTKFDGTQITIE